VKKIRSLLSQAFSAWEPHSEWPFMLFLTFVFVFIYIWTVTISTRVREPITLAFFTILFNIHLGLHWVTIWWLKKNWSVWLYLGIQTALVFVLVTLSREIGPLIGLYLGLVGEAVGMLVTNRRRAVGVLGILAASGANYYWIMQGGQIFWWVLGILPMTFFVIIYVLLYSRQADARVKAQELLVELEAANRRLTEYADQIEDLTLTNERQRMARELHDTLAQGLAGLILQLEAVDSHLSQGHADRAQTIVQQAMTRARGTLADSRRAIDGLRNPLSGGLQGSIQAEVDHFISATGLPCSLDLSLAAPLPTRLEELAIRAVSECLTNIARHAQAHHGSVYLRSGDSILKIIVADDGIGFNPGEEEERSGHYGLIGLRERVRQAGGTLEIQSEESKGTTVNVKIHISEQEK
jgi:NarL family two-component system sensor histidine kinase YdfH